MNQKNNTHRNRNHNYNHQCFCLKIIHCVQHVNPNIIIDVFLFQLSIANIAMSDHINPTYPAHSHLRTRHNSWIQSQTVLTNVGPTIIFWLWCTMHYNDRNYHSYAYTAALVECAEVQSSTCGMAGTEQHLWHGRYRAAPIAWQVQSSTVALQA